MRLNRRSQLTAFIAADHTTKETAFLGAFLLGGSRADHKAQLDVDLEVTVDEHVGPRELREPFMFLVCPLVSELFGAIRVMRART